MLRIQKTPLAPNACCSNFQIHCNPICANGAGLLSGQGTLRCSALNNTKKSVDALKLGLLSRPENRFRQGGNTGLFGGQMPDDEKKTRYLVYRTDLNAIRNLDSEGNSITVEKRVLFAGANHRQLPMQTGFPTVARLTGLACQNWRQHQQCGRTGVLAYEITANLVLGLISVLADGRTGNGHA